MHRNVIAAALVLAAPALFAGEADDLASAYLSGEPITNLPAIADAAAFQSNFVAALEPVLGAPVGYKAALTNPRAQAMFKADAPLSGVLLERMLRPSGSEVSIDEGARLLVEADLLVRVGDASINDAATDGEFLRAIDAVIPFLEMPDAALATNLVMDATTLEALNAGARTGVKGEPIAIASAGDWMQRLGFFRVDVRDQSGTTLADGNGGALLGHPIAALRWLRDDLKGRGVVLKPGDLLSLGSLTPPVPAQPDTCITATYVNLSPEGPVAVKVCITPPPAR